jgi:hypothetical protein
MSGGAFALAVSIGQPDAGEMIGGGLTFRGGFLGYALDKVVPVLLHEALVEARPGLVVITWRAQGVEGEVFDIWRALDDDAPQTLVSPPAGIRVDTEGRGTFSDTAVQPGRRYVYTLGIRDGDGTETRIRIGEATLPPSLFALRQNTPNPFNPATRIAFDLPAASAVRLVILDASGREVRRLLAEALDAGAHAVVWDGRDELGNAVGSGVYFYRLFADGLSATRKMMVVK